MSCVSLGRRPDTQTPRAEFVTPFRVDDHGWETHSEGLRAMGAAADGLAHLSALALAGLFIMFLRLERLQYPFTLQHALKAPQRLLQ